MVNVKICGVISRTDAEMCVRAGADFIGNIVDIPSSPRSITVERSKAILSSLPSKAGGMIVMAPKTVEEVVVAAGQINPWGVQLHGGEDMDFVEELREALSCRLVKAVSVKGEATIEEAVRFSEVCDAILLDTHAEELGGTGIVHDWQVSARIVEDAKCDVFLAGGLNPENVERAVHMVKPFAVDSSSGVEMSPGAKDPEKVRRFIEGAKGPAQS